MLVPSFSTLPLTLLISFLYSYLTLNLLPLLILLLFNVISSFPPLLPFFLFSNPFSMSYSLFFPFLFPFFKSSSFFSFRVTFLPLPRSGLLSFFTSLSSHSSPFSSPFFSLLNVPLSPLSRSPNPFSPRPFTVWGSHTP